MEVTRLKEYVELTPAEAIQADCDIKAINIILQGLPTEIYALVSQHRVAKDLWEKIKLLMQGTSLTKQERECKLTSQMPLEQFQVNTKFLNTLPDEWSKFVTDVKLVKDLHTTNVDQLHAYLQQHERHANESSQFVTPYQTQQFTTNQSTPLSITYPSNEYQSTIHHNVYSPQPSIPQLEYAPTAYQQQQPEFSHQLQFSVPVFQKGDDPIVAIKSHEGRSYCQAVYKSQEEEGMKHGFNDKEVCWFQDQASCHSLTEEEIDFCKSPGLPDIKPLRLTSPTMHLIKADDL
ncbi:hypothetical protein Tco_0525920 [Tanacetum coccineum]